MTDDEARWIERARAGDAAAFRRLVDAHSRALFHVCARITRDASIAEDAVQEALLNAYRHLREFDGRSAFSTWLHRIAVNAALEQLRKRRRNDEAVELPDADAESHLFDDDAPGPERLATSAAAGRRIADQLQRMSAIERTAFVLRHHEGRSIDEIATTLSLSESSSKQAIFRAVRKLRAALEPIDMAV